MSFYTIWPLRSNSVTSGQHKYHGFVLYKASKTHWAEMNSDEGVISLTQISELFLDHVDVIYLGIHDILADFSLKQINADAIDQAIATYIWS